MEAIINAIRDGFTVHIEPTELGVTVRLVKDKFFQQTMVVRELVFCTDCPVIQTLIEELQKTFRTSATFTGKIPTRLKPDCF